MANLFEWLNGTSHGLKKDFYQALMFEQSKKLYKKFYLLELKERTKPQTISLSREEYLSFFLITDEIDFNADLFTQLTVQTMRDLIHKTCA